MLPWIIDALLLTSQTLHFESSQRVVLNYVTKLTYGWTLTAEKEGDLRYEFKPQENILLKS